MYHIHVHVEWLLHYLRTYSELECAYSQQTWKIGSSKNCSVGRVKNNWSSSSCLSTTPEEEGILILSKALPARKEENEVNLYIHWLVSNTGGLVWHHLLDSGQAHVDKTSNSIQLVNGSLQKTQQSKQKMVTEWASSETKQESGHVLKHTW